MEELKRSIKIDANQPELSDVMVPNCVYRCGCPEFQACGFFNKFMDYMYSHDYQNVADIHQRYEAYNKLFWENNNG